ncbi:MAG: type II secretion system protein, partial [Polyangiaceae bacterium]
MLGRARRVPRNAGFTLVELMVALTGGLFISLAVFALSRDSGRFYQNETRIANATVGGLLGFERLRADIARAGFLISPNAARDGRLCGSPGNDWPVALQNLAGIRVTTPVGNYPRLAANGRNPPALVLAGSYASSDLYSATSYTAGARIVFNLGNLYPDHPAQPALLRLSGTEGWPTQSAVAAVFPVGGALRIVQNGRQYYGIVSAVTGGKTPSVTITNVPPIQQLGSGPGCGLNVIGSAASKATINTINFVRYQLGVPTTVTGVANYQPLYAASNLGDAAPGEAGRTELIRVEQALDGTDINGTEEIVAEYAVDFDVQITAAVPGAGNPTLLVVPPSSTQFATYTGGTFGTANTPELIRSVRVRLGVRSREGDRGVTIANPSGGGLFRF